MGDGMKEAKRDHTKEETKEETFDWEVLPKQWFSMVLYTNPVCLLSTQKITKTDDSTKKIESNVMTISWLTAYNNSGGFMCSMNKRRHSADLLNKSNPFFCLSIPCTKQAELVLKIGSCHGNKVDKYSSLNIKRIDVLPLLTIPKKYKTDGPANVYGVNGCVAHLVCFLEKLQSAPDGAHNILFCQIVGAVVANSYWTGRTFVGFPPHLAFLGSQQFAQTIAL